MRAIPQSRRRAAPVLARSIFALGACVMVLGSPASGETYLGRLSANPHAPDSTANPARRHAPDSVTNPMGRYGSPFGAQSANNPFAADAPTLVDDAGKYRGKLSANPFDPDSISNPYGRYGSEYSPDSINNPFGAGNRHAPDSPRNPFGTGLKIYGKE